MSKKATWTYDMVKEYIEDKECELLSTHYINNKQKLKIKCKCGEIFERSFGDYKNKSMFHCKYCSGKKIAYEYAFNFIQSKNCNLITSKSEYKNSTQKLTIECSCGEYYNISFSDFKRFKQYHCPKCGNNIRVENMKSKQLEDFNYYNYEQVKQIIDNTQSKLLSKDYTNCFDKLELKCECGNIYKQNFSHIKSKIKNNSPILCPKCMKEISDNKFRLTEYEINKEIYEVYGYQKYKIVNINDYKNRKEKTKFIHTECGHIFETSLSNLIIKERNCPECERYITRGIAKIIHFLENEGIEYELEKRFKDCKFKRYLPFDIYMPKFNALIEFDGRQHYEIIEHFGGVDEFINIKIRDTFKTEYCKNNNIPLLRIRYDEFKNINNILNDFIDKLIPS